MYVILLPVHGDGTNLFVIAKFFTFTYFYCVVFMVLSFIYLQIKQLELGDQFPEIKTLRVHNVELDESGERIENLDLLLEIHYMGNFRTSIDADMVLGKKGSLTLKGNNDLEIITIITNKTII